MKIVSLVLLTFILGKGCNAGSQQDLQTAVVEYTANSRGYFQKIVLNNQTISISNDRNTTEIVVGKIADSDWEALVSELKKIDLESIPNWKAPTKKRFYDGAAMANLKITYKDKIYESTTFDNGFPPKEIKNFVDKITTLAKRKDEN